MLAASSAETRSSTSDAYRKLLLPAETLPFLFYHTRTRHFCDGARFVTAAGVDDKHFVSKRDALQTRFKLPCRVKGDYHD